jgi:hypothetical protein
MKSLVLSRCRRLHYAGRSPLSGILRVLLAEYGCPVECIAVFAASHCVLDPTLPETILQASEFHHFMRTRLNRFRDGHRRYLDSERIGKYLQLRCADWGKSYK